jgi:hypothetical protein
MGIVQSSQSFWLLASGCSGSPAAKISKPVAQKAQQQQARSTNAGTKHQAEQEQEQEQAGRAFS